MIYHEKQIKLDSPLSFWKRFEHEERFLFYNPQKKEFICGAKRLKALSTEDSKKYLYTFTTMTFFDKIKDQKWAGFDNETIAFEYYLVIRDGKQILYYLKEPVEIENMKMKIYKHQYRNVTEDFEDWKQLFSVVDNAISGKEVNKVVVSREVKIECNTLINVQSVMQNLLKQNPDCFVFAYFKGGKTFLGATPEVLVEKENNNIISYALAGTIPRTGENDALQGKILLADAKNHNEHKIVIDSIFEVMRKYTHDLVVDETTILTLKRLLHLKTRIHAKDENSTLYEWVKRLHPTPAVGGNPVNKALELIKTYEKHERGLYAAPIGIVGRNGDGIFITCIRSALVYENIVFAYAGCGIVNESDCETEYIETNNKLKTIIESL
ncbi:MAG: isochorismate synthase [Ruminiclostridium sp.]|nr:isochorismate synthase [Ruminiclostridium sp.]